MTQSGADDYVYQEVFDWARLPEGWDIGEVVDVAVDSDDRVFVFSRGEHPLMVFEQDGSFIRAWGEGLFRRPHGLTLAKDELRGAVLYCVDDGGHWIGKFTLDGELLMALGKRGEPAPRMSGQPFNRPTKVAIDPKSGELYISDGYGNARIHKYTTDGQHLFSWGDSGVDPGQFNLPHSVCTDRQIPLVILERV